MSAILSAVVAVLCVVRQIITHKNPDWDAVVSVFLLRLFGREQFQGIENAPVLFSEKTVLGKDADHDRDGVVPVDTGKGRFSEHHGPNGRMIGKCATVLVAEFFKVIRRPELSRLIEATRSADNDGRSSVTSAPSLMKMAYRCGAQQQLVFCWATKMVEAIVRNEQYRYAEVVGEKSLRQWFDCLVAEEGSTLLKEGRIHDWIVRSIVASESKIEDILELAHVLRCLQRSGFSKSDTGNFLRFWFGMMQKDQEMFQAELERVRPLRKGMLSVLALTTDHREVRVNLLVLDKTDSNHAVKVAMYHDRESGCMPADIVLVKNCSGNVQIYTNKKRMQNISLDNVWKAIRWLELPPEKRSKIGPDQIEGSFYDSEKWYYFELGGAIFNGSLTNERPPTKVPLALHVSALQFCLHPAGCRRFMDLFARKEAA
jgi:hypothetical protein